MNKRFEVITTLVVLVVALLVGGRFVADFVGTRRAALSAGDKMPNISGHDWTPNRTLVVALKKGCPYCEHSMPFYRRLAAMQKAGELNGRLIAIFPDDARVATEIMQQQQLSFPVFSGLDMRSLRINGTPTLVLVDQRGRVIKPWVGELNGTGELDVINALR
jgi:thiol-disulfide isomerase/thioredoxin